jgi:VWFA-related protein
MVAGQGIGSSKRVSFSFVGRDAKGQVIQDLRPGEIQVKVDGKERTVVELVTPEKAPALLIGAIFDVSASEDRMIVQNAQADLLGFFRCALRPGDRAFVGEFGESIRQLSTISDDPVYLASSVSSASKAHGKTALFDAVAAVLNHQFANVEGRKAVVILSDGDSNADHVSMKQVIEALKRDNAIIYTILINPPRTVLMGKAPLVLDPKYVSGFDPMVVFPEVTGGSEEVSNDDTQLVEAFNRIAMALRTTYTVICLADSSDRNGKLHKIKVKINRKGAQAFARDSYYAPQN